MFQVLTVSVFCHIPDKTCTTCLLISKSFKELFFMAFFRKADAKVRQIFELPKLFEVFFENFFSSGGGSNLIPCFQHFNFIAFPSRKRMQNYCFTTYQPNVQANFFTLFYFFFANPLICRHVLRQDFSYAFRRMVKLHLSIITRAYVCMYTYG